MNGRSHTRRGEITTFALVEAMEFSVALVISKTVEENEGLCSAIPSSGHKPYSPDGGVWQTTPPPPQPPILRHTTQPLTLNSSALTTRTSTTPSKPSPKPPWSVPSSSTSSASLPSKSIPTYNFCTSSAAATIAFLYLPTIHKQTTKSFKDLKTTILHFPGLPPIRASHMPHPLLDRDDQAYHHMLYFASQLPKLKGIIANTFKSLEPKAIKTIAEGICVPDAPTPPVKEVAIGLEKSGHRFLWVVHNPPTDENGKRISAAEDSDLDALLPEGFLDRTQGRGLVIKSWAPQVAVLSRESVGGFVTHCGWNSVLEAVSAGVPMVAWPLYAEQHINKAVLVEDMKMAIPMEPSNDDGFVSSAEVNNRVRELMGSEEGKALRRRSQEMRKSAMAAWSEFGSSMTAFTELTESWKQC
ncbi:hypothetical protein HHK36_030335 [Tetracentron sinense]|uniref:Glycosyltransferase n=1 Tax=Tetracentron sinense TaxID=13715 RepID=A0A834Y9Q0_TETSI|nr:hypothetical protein HHK36_030335 [Tetracentron sinense]